MECEYSVGKSDWCDFKLICALLGVPLDDTQNNELSKPISSIGNSDTGSAILRSIYNEAEDSGQGRGEVLREIWNKSHDRASFFQDQQKKQYVLLFLQILSVIDVLQL